MLGTDSPASDQAEAAATILDPQTYVTGVPHDAFARLRREGVVRVPEPAVGGWPAGPGFWAVLRHRDVERVLRTPRVFSSSLGLTQIYDAPDPFLPYARQQMINMDPPEHARLRGLLTRAFTPRAVARLEERIADRARALVDAVADDGVCDFSRDVAADLPLRTLADVLGVPESDRWLMFDWANRVIGLLDDEYAASDVFRADGADGATGLTGTPTWPAARSPSGRSPAPTGACRTRGGPRAWPTCTRTRASSPTTSGATRATTS